MMINQWLIAAVVFAVLGMLLSGLHSYQLRRHPAPELVRKLMHIGMGLVALTFPWLFRSGVPVYVLAAAAVVLLWLVRHSGLLHRYLGGVIDGVERASYGELYFPIGLALLFWLSGGDPLLYCIPLLILTLADAVAALIGIRYGTARYTTVDGSKSVEGSLAFFLMAFLSTLVPLQLFSDVGRAETLLIALTIGVLVMLIEAIAWRGLDNLLIPVIGVLLLNTFLKLGSTSLLGHFLVITTLAILMFLFRSRGTLDDSALLATVLMGYIIWALGGWMWLYPPTVLFLRDRLRTFHRHTGEARHHNVQSVLTICGPGLLWLIAYRLTGQSLLFFPYVLTFGAHLAIFETTRFMYRAPQARRWLVLTYSVLLAWACMFAPYVLLLHFTRPALLMTALGIIPIALAALGFMWLQPQVEDCPRDMPRWWRQAAGAMLAAVVGMMAVFWQATRV
ncbi:MAG: hypothetical protein M3007_01035 [Candidatus Eremiobacteraeota bacterium]|nr:hypothetical protein [Candidatus Eremiobacteraeota bacterium]